MVNRDLSGRNVVKTNTINVKKAPAFIVQLVPIRRVLVGVDRVDERDRNVLLAWDS